MVINFVLVQICLGVKAINSVLDIFYIFASQPWHLPVLLNQLNLVRLYFNYLVLLLFKAFLKCYG